MTGLSWWGYAAVFATTTAVAVFLTPLALRLALRWEILDRPSEIKAQASPVPYLGGAAIVVAFALVIGVAAAVRPPVSGLEDLWIILGMAVGLSLVGLADDIRGLGPWIRLAVEGAAGAGVLATGTHILVFRSGPLDDLITIVWVVGVTNAFNILDNMDGLSAGVTAVSSMSLFIVAYLNGQFLVAVMSLALVGCAAGFLRHNFHPARIYMGDAGSLFLGFLLAVLCMRLRTNPSTRITIFVPILILGVALFDTALVTIARLLHRRSPLSGGRDHTSHRLVFVGVPVPVAVSLIYAVAAGLGWLSIVVARIDRTSMLVLVGLVGAVALFVGTLLGMVPVYETSRRRRFVLQEVRRHEVEPVVPPGHSGQRSEADQVPDDREDESGVTAMRLDGGTAASRL
ncbi:MAG TPA: MraY family glycosyltransferase [Acidimicrobiales bacterium]|nr:MraY family glycosyltransferase [Acidimicrobiales bacterium]